tara:strand:- start:726 stop:1055 length:330 start_codon:yes stop_codon:yes gene_type:complete
MKVFPGELVQIDINKEFSPEKLKVLPTDFGKPRLYEKISTESFPGWDDFKGYSRLFDNEALLVISKKGRPCSFSKKENWDLYDVYVVMYSNKTYECFSYCMKKISDEQP